MQDTPSYVFDHFVIEDCWEGLKSDLFFCEVYYALKANSEIPVLATLNNIGANFEVASVGEFDKLVQLGVCAKRIICSLPVKPPAMIKKLYSHGCRYFAFDHYDEFMKLQQLAPLSKKILRISIADIVPNSIPFGADISEVIEWCDNPNINSDFDGVTFYLRKNYHSENLDKVLDRCEQVLSILGKGEKILNLGGNYRSSTDGEPFFYDRLNLRIQQMKCKHDLKIIAEIGRSVIKYAGRLITEVILVKDKGAFSEIFIDAGLPTGISYSPKKITIMGKDPSENYKHYRFFGPTCCHSLLFELTIPLSIELGDKLILHDFGSYSICKASNFHGMTKPSVVFE